MWQGLAVQTPLLVLTALVLDGGWMFRMFTTALIAIYVQVLIVMLRRSQHATASDVVMAKWGVLLWFPLTLACGNHLAGALR